MWQVGRGGDNGVRDGTRGRGMAQGNKGMGQGDKGLGQGSNWRHKGIGDGTGG